MAWIATSLYPGPPATNNYAFTIGGLAPSTNYQYRAYFIIDGVPYYGNVLEGTTAAITLVEPEVTTGTALNVTTTSFNVCSNEVDEDGGAPIVEYGILYTQTSILGTCANLIYGNVGNFVRKTSCCASICLGNAYCMAANCCLSPSTTTYYRAFARNAAGSGYGSVKTKITAAPPVTYMNVEVTVSWGDPAHCDFNDGFGGVMRLFCCNGTLSQSCTISPYAKNVTADWSVVTGCYYMDFSGLNAYEDYSQIAYDLTWTDNTHAFPINSCCTCCFTGNNCIEAVLPTLMW